MRGLIERFNNTPVNLYCIKTVHNEKWIAQDEFDVNEYYLDVHVEELKHQLDQNIKRHCSFTLLTNKTEIQNPSIEIVDVSEYDLWGWWNKMLLFKKGISKPGLNVYVDLDTVIQRDITDILLYAVRDKLTLLYGYYKPIDWEQTAYRASGNNPAFKHASLFNTSFMMWYDDTLDYVWDNFYNSPDFDKNMVRFRGNDEYMKVYHNDIFKALPRGLFYSYFYGAHQGSEFFRHDKDAYVKRDEYFVRMLNGLGKRGDRLTVNPTQNKSTKRLIDRQLELEDGTNKLSNP